MKPQFALVILAFFTLALLPSVQGVSYGPGVKVGDWARYTVSGMSPSMMGIQNMGTMEAHVQGISGTNVSVSMTTNRMMGSQTSHNGWFDMQQGIGSMDMMDMMTTLNNDMSMGMDMTTMSQGMTLSGMRNLSFFMAGGLSSGTPIFHGARLTINQTFMRNYLGAGREVNQLQVIKTYNGHTFNMTTYWDQTTGLMTESTITQTGSTQAVSLQLASTSFWGSLDLYPLGPLVAVALLAVVVLMARRLFPSVLGERVS